MSRSKWEEMTSFPRELAGAVKQATSDIAKRDAAKKAKQYEQEAASRAASRKTEAPAKQVESVSDENKFSVEKIKARNKYMSDL